MSCPTTKCLCDNLIISQAVTFANNTLTINLPAGNYGNGCKYCIIIGQAIPATTTITANVVITIGTSTTAYPLLNCDCTNVTACQINTRTRYSTKVITNIQSGVFKLLGPVKCCPRRRSAASLPIPTAATTPAATENA